jgi:hypothetical protein
MQARFEGVEHLKSLQAAQGNGAQELFETLRA